MTVSRLGRAEHPRPAQGLIITSGEEGILSEAEATVRGLSIRQASTSWLITSLIDDIESAPVEDNLKPVMKFVRKLTLEPTKMVPGDGEAVFAAGWNERALYDAIIIRCTWSFMNRYVEGLGLSVIPGQFGMEGKRLHAGYDKIFETFDLK